MNSKEIINEIAKREAKIFTLEEEIKDIISKNCVSISITHNSGSSSKYTIIEILKNNHIDYISIEWNGRQGCIGTVSLIIAKNNDIANIVSILKNNLQDDNRMEIVINK